MKIIKMFAAAFVGMMMLAGIASAQTYNVIAQPFATSGATGTYNVVLFLSGTNYTITANGVADGASDKHPADQMSFTFGSTPVATSLSGAVTSGTDASGTATAGNLDTSGIGSSTIRYGTPTLFPSRSLLAFGGNTFTASGTLSQPFNSGLFKVAFQDGGQNWANSIAITPESTSSLLMVAGLIPFGLVAWRKSRGKTARMTA